jgi:hypothetical protein
VNCRPSPEGCGKGPSSPIGTCSASSIFYSTAKSKSCITTAAGALSADRLAITLISLQLGAAKDQQPSFVVLCPLYSVPSPTPKGCHPGKGPSSPSRTCRCTGCRPAKSKSCITTAAGPRNAETSNYEILLQLGAAKD